MTNSHFVTCAQMKEIEKKAAENGLSYVQMMENAGTQAANAIMRYKAVSGVKALIFCGKGNNGGDGFVVARKLKEAGANPQVVLAEGLPITADALHNFSLCQTLRIPIIHLSDLLVESADGTLWGQPPAAIHVDAIYGTGFRDLLKEKILALTKAINRSNATCFSLDIPSGLNGDTGDADPNAVRADYTLVFHAFKPVHARESAKGYCGMIELLDIGITK